MACYNNNCYLPQPPRAWSRVQNSCSLNIDNNVNNDAIAMLTKGNVLQYKKNSSNLTKAQKYSKIAKGEWINRNTTWATQSDRGYTNPNTTMLLRSGNVKNIAIDPITGAILGETTEPVTCPTPITPINEGLPVPSGGNSDINDPEIPPPVIPSPASDTFPPIIPDTPVDPIVIQDGGILVCSVQENPCTGEANKNGGSKLCYPTTDSNVPGKIQDLCWNNGTQTWYPKQRYVMSNSTNKWPYNAKLTNAIQILPPFITNITNKDGIIQLNWTYDYTCMPINLFSIFQNNLLVSSVSKTTFSTTISVKQPGTYQYYIIAENTTAKSKSMKSNIVSITY